MGLYYESIVVEVTLRDAVRGFTLIELMVVVTLMGLLVAGGVAAYNSFNDKQKVRQAADNLMTDLRIVQKKADKGEIKGTCGCLKGYQIEGTDMDTYVLKPFCDNSLPYDCKAGFVAVDSEAESRDLTNETQFSAGSWGPYVFGGLSKGLMNTGGVPIGQQTITLILPGTSLTASVILEASGAIRASY